jgi:regulator of replication initiation timing
MTEQIPLSQFIAEMQNGMVVLLQAIEELKKSATAQLELNADLIQAVQVLAARLDNAEATILEMTRARLPAVSATLH